MFVLLFSSLLPLFPSSFLLFSFVLAFFSSSSSPCFTFSTEPSPFSRFFFFSNLSYLFFSSFLTSEASSFLTLNCTMIFLKKKKKKKKKNGCSSWARGEQEGLSWTQPGDAPDRHPCSCSELSSSRKISVLPMSQFSKLLWQCGFFEGNSDSAYGGLCKSIDCHWAFRKVYPPVHNFLSKKKKKQPLANRKIQKPSSLEEEDSCGEHATGELRRGWQKTSEPHYFQQSKVNEQGRAMLRTPSLTQTLIIQSVYSSKLKQLKKVVCVCFNLYVYVCKYAAEPDTVNYRYNVIDGTLKKLRYIRFYVIPVPVFASKYVHTEKA